MTGSRINAIVLDNKILSEEKMLLRFSVENYRSFRKEATFDMIPADLSDEGKQDHLIVDDSGAGKKKGRLVNALPISAIYGANASGKSNLVKALEFVSKFVLRGGDQDKAESNKKQIPRIPFLLDDQGKDSPSRFEIVFKMEGVVYTYGFSVTNEKVMEEWLFAYYTPKTETTLFERKYDQGNTAEHGKTFFEYGPKLAELKEEKPEKWVHDNELFLTFAYEKIAVLAPVYRWFERLIIVSLRSYYSQLAKRINEEPDFKQFVSDLLSMADTGISGIIGKKEEITPEQDLREHLREIQDNILFERTQNSDKKYLYYLQSEHVTNQGKIIEFPIKFESEGTRRLLHLLPILYMVTQKDQIFIVDELDNSLHTMLSRWFIENFIKLGMRRKQSQFIYTTHDTNLLDRSLLRRDEIWFTEKDASGSTHFTRLSEYQGTENLNFEKGYLNGRFGAIPFIQTNGDNILWQDGLPPEDAKN